MRPACIAAEMRGVYRCGIGSDPGRPHNRVQGTRLVHKVFRPVREPRLKQYEGEVVNRMASNERAQTWVVDYSAARARAIKWLGDRYLLAKPINASENGWRKVPRMPFYSAPVAESPVRTALPEAVG